MAGSPDLGAVHPAPFLEPLLKVLKKGGADWGWQEQCNLRSCAIGGQWPQQRLHAAGLSPHATCRLCGEGGCLWHRLYKCPAIGGWRDQYEHPVLFRAASRHPDWPLWVRGLVGDPTFAYPPPALVPDMVWTICPPGGRLEGTIYGDGSGSRGQYRRLRRCGWGIATISDRNVYTAKLHGPLPGWQQDVPLAESFAFYMGLRLAFGRCDFVTDCRFVLDTFQAGPSHSSTGWFVYAELWRQIWHHVDDIGVD